MAPKDDKVNARGPRGRDEKAASLDLSVKAVMAKERAAVKAKIERLRAQRLAKDAKD